MQNILVQNLQIPVGRILISVNKQVTGKGRSFTFDPSLSVREAVIRILKPI